MKRAAKERVEISWEGGFDFQWTKVAEIVPGKFELRLPGFGRWRG
jgi:hypothetical protein